MEYYKAQDMPSEHRAEERTLQRFRRVGQTQSSSRLSRRLFFADPFSHRLPGESIFPRGRHSWLGFLAVSSERWFTTSRRLGHIWRHRQERQERRRRSCCIWRLRVRDVGNSVRCLRSRIHRRVRRPTPRYRNSRTRHFRLRSQLGTPLHVLLYTPNARVVRRTLGSGGTPSPLYFIESGYFDGITCCLASTAKH